MYLVISEKRLKKIMKKIREDLNDRLWKHYAKYACMEIKKIIKNESAHDYSDGYSNILKEYLL